MSQMDSLDRKIESMLENLAEEDCERICKNPKLLLYNSSCLRFYQDAKWIKIIWASALFAEVKLDATPAKTKFRTLLKLALESLERFGFYYRQNLEQILIELDLGNA